MECPLCYTCHNILSQKTVYCSCCKKCYHLRCTSIDEHEYDMSEWSSWTCSECVSIFPYRDIDDENLAAEYKRPSVPNDMGFNLLELSNQRNTKFMECFDPDSNCLNSLTSESHSCDYFSIDHFNTLLQDMLEPQSKQFSTFHLNLRSLSKNHDLLIHFLSSLNHTFSILAFTETWLSNESTSFFDIPNYHSLHHCRTGRGGGGVSIYVHHELQVKPRDDLVLNSESCDVESLFLEIPSCDVFAGKCVIIGCIYKPPDANIEYFNSSLACVLNKINREGKVCFLLGDFNINLFHSESHSLTADFLNMLYTNSLYPLITKPTRVTASSATLIDNIFTNSLNNVWKSGVFYSDISDHFPVFHLTSTSLNIHQEVAKPQRSRVFNERNIVCFEKQIGDVQWDDVYTHDDVEQAYQSLMASFNSVFNQCFPLVSKKTKKDRTFRKPWFTPGLHKSLLTKNKLYKKCISNPSLSNTTNYKKYRNKYNHLIRIVKKKYFSNKFDEASNNIKSTWGVINQLLNRNKSSATLPSQFADENREYSDPSEIACAFNNYFVNIGSVLSKRIDHIDGSPIEFLKGCYHPIQSFNPPTEKEIIDIITSLKDSASGHDEIRSSLIIRISSSIIRPLTYVLTKSLETGLIPKYLKIAKVVPVFKSGDCSQFSNYRPISVLPCFSKVLEKLVYNRMMNHLQKWDILYEHQYGFRKKHSTEMAILQLVDKIHIAFNKNEYALGIFLDLSKAFDTVNYDILLQKLLHYGFSGTTYKWLNNYIHNRQQFVNVNGFSSEYSTLTCGVPQGSILGPLLFLIYINDLSAVMSCLFPVLFADDTNLFFSHNDFSVLMAKANSDLEYISKWFKLNKLSLNVKKSSFIVFTSKNKTYHKYDSNLFIGNNQIAHVSSTSFLGILIDERLSWKSHIYHVCNKISKSVGIIRKFRSLVNQKCLLTLYYSLIYPYLTYCNIIWGATYPTHLHKLYLLQKRFCRISTFSDWIAHSDPLFKQLNILTIFNLNEYLTCIFIFNVLSQDISTPLPCKAFFQVNCKVHNINTRQAKLLHLPFYRTGLCQFSIRYRGVQLWNNIYHLVSQSKSLNHFKHKFKIYLMNLT